MSNPDFSNTLWKLTDGNDNPLKHYKDQNAAEIFLEHETLQKRSAKLYCRLEQPGTADKEAQWLLYDYNCDLQTGDFVRR
jgi:hypothetical protein